MCIHFIKSIIHCYDNHIYLNIGYEIYTIIPHDLIF
jgi:hypothetical protein